jgi:hypothetical protein
MALIEGSIVASSHLFYSAPKFDPFKPTTTLKSFAHDFVGLSCLALRC